MSLRRILFSVSTSHSAILVSCDFILVTSFPAAPLTSQPHRSLPPLGTQSTNRTTTSPAEATTGEIQQLLRPLLPLIGLFAGWCWCWFGLAGVGFFRGKHCWLTGLGWLKPTNEQADY